MGKICLVCKTSFEKPKGYSYSQWRERLTCSRECSANKQSQDKKGIHNSPSTEIKSGQRLSPKTEFKKKPGKRMVLGYNLNYVKNHQKARSNGYVLEHRLVMEKIIGRALKDEEVVHHVNGIRNDNRPENLELFESVGAHTRHHLKMKI